MFISMLSHKIENKAFKSNQSSVVLMFKNARQITKIHPMYGEVTPSLCKGKERNYKITPKLLYGRRWEGRKFPTMRAGLIHVSRDRLNQTKADLHGIGVTTDSKGETTGNSFRQVIVIGAFQCAAGKHSLLSTVKGDGSEFLPVAD